MPSDRNVESTLTKDPANGMIVAASTTLLADSRAGAGAGRCRRGLLVAGSVTSLAANVAVAEPSLTARGDRDVAFVRPHGLLRAANPLGAPRRCRQGQAGFPTVSTTARTADGHGARARARVALGRPISAGQGPQRW